MGKGVTLSTVRAVSGRGTVPQVFIGGQHIGGADDLEAEVGEEVLREHRLVHAEALVGRLPFGIAVRERLDRRRADVRADTDGDRRHRGHRSAEPRE